MKSIFENVIQKGGYDLGEILSKIDICFVEGKLTAEERNTLYELARVKPEAQYDVKAEIEKLWLAVKALQNGVSDSGENKVAEWVLPTGAHDAYNKGDKILFTDGKVYVSVIDSNVWSPLVYPQGWKIVE